MVLSISNFKNCRVYITLGIGLLGVLCIVMLNWYISTHFEEDEQRTETRFWMNKAKPTKKFDMVFVGDSRCYRGIDPAVFEKELGLQAFNAGFSSGGHNAEIYNHISNNLLSESRRNNRMIVLAITPYSMSDEARGNQQLQALLNKKESAHQKYTDILFKKKIISRLKKVSKKKTFVREIYHANGWCETLKNISEKSQKRGLDIYNAIYIKNSFSRKSFDELTEYTNRWMKDDIRVFAFVPPTTPDMKKLEETKSGCDMHIVKAAFEKAGGVWIDIEDEHKYSAYDSSHLSGDQAVVLSKYLSRKIREML